MKVLFFRNKMISFSLLSVAAVVFLTACGTNKSATEQSQTTLTFPLQVSPTPTELSSVSETLSGASKYYEKRPNYMPGEPVDYIVQPGDTVSALASRFNTTQSEILKANPIIPAVTTTLPPGMPMKIPIYYRSQ